MTSPENPDNSDAGDRQNAERTTVITRSGTGDPATAAQQGESANQPTVTTPTPSTPATQSTPPTASAPPASPALSGTSGTSVSSGEGAEPAVPSNPPPWQRVTSDEQYTEAYHADEPTAQVAQPTATPGGHNGPAEATSANEYPLVTGTAAPQAAPGAQFGVPPGGRTTVNVGAATGTATRATPSALRRPGRGPRRASLHVKRVDPWSVLKLALVLSVVLFFVWLVAVGVLYGVLDGMGVWDKLNGTYNDLVQGGQDGGSGGSLISVGRVFGIAAVLGAINIVLFTALATVGAFVYNVSADLVGGLELTLAERE